MLAVAASIWGPLPAEKCPYGPQVVSQTLPGQVIGRAEVPGCKMWLDPAIGKLPEGQQCAVIVHEFGHMRGHKHSTRPRSVMFPMISRRNVPSACRPPR